MSNNINLNRLNNINYKLTKNIKWGVFSSGHVDINSNAYYAMGVVPVLSLNSELDIGLGSGTSSNPYQLNV